MIVALADTKDGKKALLIGLSGMNLAKLSAGKPIVIASLKHEGCLPPGWEVVIFYGETEETIERDMRKAGVIDSETEMKHIPRTPAP